MFCLRSAGMRKETGATEYKKQGRGKSYHMGKNFVPKHCVFSEYPYARGCRKLDEMP